MNTIFECITEIIIESSLNATTNHKYNLWILTLSILVLVIIVALYV